MKKLREYKKTNVILSAVIFLVVGGFLTVNALAAWQSSGGDTYHTSGSVAIGPTPYYSTYLYLEGNNNTKIPVMTIDNQGSEGDAAMRFSFQEENKSWAMGFKDYPSGSEGSESFRLTYKNGNFANLTDELMFSVKPDGKFGLGTNNQEAKLHIKQGSNNAGMVMEDDTSTIVNGKKFRTTVNGGHYKIMPLNDNGTTKNGIGTMLKLSNNGDICIGTNC